MQNAETGKLHVSPQARHKSGPSARQTVLIISPQPFFEERGTPIALLLVATGLAELGYDVDFLTFPIGKDIEIPGVNVIRVGNPMRFASVPIGFSLRKLFLDLLLFKKARTLLKSNSYVRVHASEEAIFAPLMFLRNGRHRVVYDMASSIPEQLMAFSLFRLRFIQRCLSNLERYALNSVGYVFCSSGLLDEVRKIAPYTPASEWIFPSRGAPVTKEVVHQLHEDLDLPTDAFLIVYAGSFSSYQGLDVVTEAIPEIAARVPSAVVILVGGTGDEVARLTSAVSLRHRDKIRVLPRQPRERMAVFFSLAKVLLSARGHGKNVPLKVFDYIAARRPIVASDVPAHRKILGGGRALLYEPNPAGLARAIQLIYSNPNKGAEMVDAASRYGAERLGWGNFLEALGRAYAHED
jgi:glycosyltransferase involved in cell wall biosynthesis